ncbi:MAG: hypothetical protein HY319_31875 [Armatimonadetes bacterium]|nr:hypothetical protein [Armatimonadota bacterium]
MGIVERLDALARRGEFWETYGVGRRQAEILRQKVPAGTDLDQAVDVFEHLFEVEARHAACPTSQAERVYLQLLRLARTPEEVPQLVEAYEKLLPFERERLLIDESRHAVEALERIGASRLEFESWSQNVAEYMKGPEAYPELKLRQAEQREKSRREAIELSTAAANATILKTDQWIRVGGITLTRKQ